MTSGQQKAQQNVDSFEVWRATQSDDDFLQIAHRGQLKRAEVAKAIGCGKSALTQNPILRQALEKLENELRIRGVLPPFTAESETVKSNPKEYDASQASRQLESRRLSQLEAENIELKAKVRALESRLERFGELSETLSEIGFMPR